MKMYRYIHLPDDNDDAACRVCKEAFYESKHAYDPAGIAPASGGGAGIDGDRALRP